ncbi:hypothetical protein COV22_00485, partial [Candidatus Woesearchaeota archaeon CG10_big_fil_rev_8_21_14_0_10_47_5]
NGKLYAASGTDGSIYVSNTSAAILQSNTSNWTSGWHHVAATFNGSMMRIYIDGELDSEYETGNTSIVHNGVDLRIGDDYSNGLFRGKIDDVVILNKSLDAGEVKGYYDSGSGGHVKVGNYTSQIFDLASGAMNGFMANLSYVNYNLSIAGSVSGGYSGGGGGGDGSLGGAASSRSCGIEGIAGAGCAGSATLQLRFGNSNSESGMSEWQSYALKDAGGLFPVNDIASSY